MTAHTAGERSRGSASAVLAVDLGGTTMKGAVFGVDGTPLYRASRPSPPGGGRPLVDTMLGFVRHLGDQAGSLSARLVGAGVLSPGVIDEARGTVVYAANLSWRNVDLAGPVAAELGVPVAVGHDVRGASLAEQAIGGGRGASDFTLVTLGTGIACAIHADGVARVGAGAAAGEIGHAPVLPGGAACACGQRGCMEAYASGASIARRYEAAGGRPGTTAAQIAGRLGADPAADRVWQEATYALGLGLTTLTLLLDPALILLGGGLAEAGDVLLTPTLAALSANLRWREAPVLRVSPLGTNAGRVGAAVLAMRTAGRHARLDSWTAKTATGPCASHESG